MTANIILVSSLTFIVFVVVILGIIISSQEKYENVNNSILRNYMKRYKLENVLSVRMDYMVL